MHTQLSYTDVKLMDCSLGCGSAIWCTKMG